MLQEKQFRREAAQKTSVGEILKGEFIETGEGAAALNINGKLARRINLLAIVVDKDSPETHSYKNAVIDDGTGQIRLRFFDTDAQLFDKLGVGDFAAIIGKPRQYGNEVYITPEILKPLSNLKWAEVRKMELMVAMQTNVNNEVKESSKPVVDAEAVDPVGKDKQRLYLMVKKLDTGRGADISEVAIKSGVGNAEETIREMLKHGDLFEVLPGRLKVLE